jgi:hypothetical protein
MSERTINSKKNNINHKMRETMTMNFKKHAANPFHIIYNT